MYAWVVEKGRNPGLSRRVKTQLLNVYVLNQEVHAHEGENFTCFLIYNLDCRDDFYSKENILSPLFYRIFIFFKTISNSIHIEWNWAAAYSSLLPYIYVEDIIQLLLFFRSVR